MFTVGHISFHTPGAEISDGLADPAFFQKVMTSASPRKEQKRECSGDLEVGRGELRPGCSSAGYPGSWLSQAVPITKLPALKLIDGRFLVEEGARADGLE